jgi:hypothetical protein
MNQNLLVMTHARKLSQQTDTYIGSQQYIFDKNASIKATLPYPILRNDYKIPGTETGVLNVCKHTPYNNAGTTGVE